PSPEAEALWRDLRPVLDEEIHQLPDKYRRPFVLCYFEGLTTEEAAEQLGCPRGTVSTRLAWARGRLWGRLTRRGVTLSAAALPVLLTQQASAAFLSPPIVAATVKAAVPFAGGKAAAGVVATKAAVLAQGAIQAMFISKLKMAAVIVLVL